MGYKVKVSLNQLIMNPMICVVCGSKTNLHPRGYVVSDVTNHLIVNYRGMFYFPVCDECGSKRSNIWQKRKRFRTPEEKKFLKLYDKIAVTCQIRYRPLFGIKSAIFTFNRKDFAETFANINHGVHIK